MLRTHRFSGPAPFRGAVLAPLALWAGCASGGLWTDLGSVSVGAPTDGRVRRPAMVRAGASVVIPRRWEERGFSYGVDELVAALERAGRAVADRHPGARLAVADLSPGSGSARPYHRSHRSGRDADILFYTVDRDGRPLPPPPDMVPFNGDGHPRGAGPGARRRFDDARNWALVEALLRDRWIRVQWIFVSKPLKARLLAHARIEGRPPWVVAYAERVLQQPRGSAPHDDHFHVRIYCPRADRAFGCRDVGPVWRHEKKTHKYGGPERYDPPTWRLVQAAGGSWPRP